MKKKVFRGLVNSIAAITLSAQLMSGSVAQVMAAETPVTTSEADIASTTGNIGGEDPQLGDYTEKTVSDGNASSGESTDNSKVNNTDLNNDSDNANNEDTNSGNNNSNSGDNDANTNANNGETNTNNPNTTTDPLDEFFDVKKLNDSPAVSDGNNDDISHSADSVTAFREAISNGESVKLTSDLSLDGDAVTIDGSNLSNDLVIDLNGYTITLSQAYAGFSIKNGAKVTFRNGKLQASREVNPGIEHAVDLRNGANLELKNVSLEGFKNSAIYAENGNLSIENCTFNDNFSPYNGAAIDITGGTFNAIGQNVFTNNSVNANGGAIFFKNVGNDITFENTTFENNSTSIDAWGAGGGAIFIEGMNKLIIGEGTSFTNNYSFSSGGAILFKGQTLEINDGVFENNTAHNREGGAIAVIGNYRKDGGPLPNSAIITKGIFKGNKSGYSKEGTPNTAYQDWGGGAIFVDDASSMELTADTVITENKAGGFGGGIAGCSTGRVFVFGDDNSGAILFNNQGGDRSNPHISGSYSEKHADHEYALENETFMQNGYDDFFCALNSTVAKKVFGNSIIEGSIDHNAIDTTKDYFVASYSTGISASLIGDTSALKGNASVLMIDNTSYTHGGAILCNGYLVVGNPNSEIISVGKSLEIYGKKSLVDKNDEAATLLDSQFGFTLKDASGKTVSTGTNNASGSISFGSRLTFDKTNWADGENSGNDKVFTYYLTENDFADTTIEKDTSEYIIKIAVSKISGQQEVGNLSLAKENYTISNVSVQKKNGTVISDYADYTFDSSDEMHAAELNLFKDNTSTFVNIIKPETEKDLEPEEPVVTPTDPTETPTEEPTETPTEEPTETPKEPTQTPSEEPAKTPETPEVPTKTPAEETVKTPETPEDNKSTPNVPKTEEPSKTPTSDETPNIVNKPDEPSDSKTPKASSDKTKKIKKEKTNNQSVLGALREKVKNSPIVLGARRALTSDSTTSLVIRFINIILAVVLIVLILAAGKRKNK